jgi:hypothetical protein
MQSYFNFYWTLRIHCYYQQKTIKFLSKCCFKDMSLECQDILYSYVNWKTQQHLKLFLKLQQLLAKTKPVINFDENMCPTYY